jgi:hypothetical protein
MMLLPLLASFLYFTPFSQESYFRGDVMAGPSRREVISLQKADSLLVLEGGWEAKKVSCDVTPDGFG